MVYKSSPTQRAPSEPPEAVPSLSGRQISADEETLRQRLISAVQRPSGSEGTGQLADTLSLRFVLAAPVKIHISFLYQTECNSPMPAVSRASESGFT